VTGRDRLRPLDPVRSIKAKLAVVVVSGAVLTASLALVGVGVLGWRLRWSLLAATVLSLLVSQVLAHGMTSPLRQMTAAARDLARGRPAPQIRATSRDEVGELARAFTAMAAELAAADGQRRQLLANVSHELRTPVAALRAQLENLADGVRPADPAALQEVLEQVERLSDLLTDLLDLARADGGAVPLERTAVPVRPLLEDVVAQVGAARPGCRLQIRVDPPDLAADADPHRLRQVVTNLVDNAARHGTAQVEVAARDRDGGLELEVTDDGPGIPPDRWQTVFERFRGGTAELPVVRDRETGTARTGGTGSSDGTGGTGLGLAIARWATVLHGGTIAVVPADGPGCRIRVRIPAQDLHIASTDRPRSPA
jgi:signal transduction histidine kinase